MYSIVKEFILPPGSLWLFIALGFALLIFRKRVLGTFIIGAALVAFYVLATPIVAGRLNAMVQTVPPLSDDAAKHASAQMIVVLSGGMHFDSPEYGGPTVDETTLARVRYAARLHRLTHLPLLVSGGQPPGATATLAAVMKQSLAEDFAIQDVTVEDKSLDTYENAAFSAAILKDSGIRRILLVTHASHMPRAERAFTEAGFHVVPAPTVFSRVSFPSSTSYIPRLSGLSESHYAIYELMGRAWYYLRH